MRPRSPNAQCRVDRDFAGFFRSSFSPTREEHQNAQEMRASRRLRVHYAALCFVPLPKYSPTLRIAPAGTRRVQDSIRRLVLVLFISRWSSDLRTRARSVSVLYPNLPPLPLALSTMSLPCACVLAAKSRSVPSRHCANNTLGIRMNESDNFCFKLLQKNNA